MILEHLNSQNMMAAAVSVGVTFAILLTILITKKSKQSDGKKLGFWSVGFTFILMSTISLLFFPFVVLLGSSFYQYAAHPMYAAKVVDVESEWVTSSGRDSSGRSYSSRSLMHTAIVEFSVPSQSGSDVVRIKNSVRSGSEPEMGEMINVVYQPGMQTANEFSFRSVFLQLAGSVMVLILGYILLLIYRYAVGKSNERLGIIGINAVFYGLLPLAIISFEAMLIYAAWMHFTGVKVIDELWAVILLCFFASTLGLVILGYALPVIRNAFKRKPFRSKHFSKE